MNQSISTKVKTRDITIGFFSWVVLSNLIFLLLTFRIVWDGSNEMLFSNIFLLLTILAILVLFILKKVWVCAGVTAALIINIGLWAAMLFLLGMRTFYGLLYNMLWMSGFPLPLGIWILLLGFA